MHSLLGADNYLCGFVTVLGVDITSQAGKRPYGLKWGGIAQNIPGVMGGI